VTAKTEAALTKSAATLFATPKDELKALGRVLNEDYLANHTWEARWRQLMQGRVPRSRTDAPGPFSRTAAPLLDPHPLSKHNKLCVTATGPINARR
jgi:hypothetical protein